MTITVGVDLAAEPKGTAVARVTWADGTAVVTDLECPATDDRIVALAEGAATIGIDSPLGWPDPFVEFVERHQRGEISVDVGAVPGWRRALTNRTTDLRCAQHTMEVLGRAVRPLSVSADLLGHTAMRASVLQAALRERGHIVDRSGLTGIVTEVYPAACLALWGLRRSYKGANRAALPHVVDALLARATWLQLREFADRCRLSDHCFDAVVAALGARAVALGRATAPPPADVDIAFREGWIRLPTCTLAGLANPPQ